MRTRLSAAWFPIAVVLVVLGSWAARREASAPPQAVRLAIAEEPARTCRATEGPIGQPPEVPKAQPAGGPAAATAPPSVPRLPAAPETRPAPTPSGQPSGAPSMGGEPVSAGKAKEGPPGGPPAGPGATPPDTSTNPKSTNPESEEGYDPARQGVGPPYPPGEQGKDTGTSGQDPSRAGTSAPGGGAGTEPGGTKTSGSPWTYLNPLTWGKTPSSTSEAGGEKKGETTQAQATREAASAFYVFEGFEGGNAWAVESAADHAELALTDEQVSEGKKALKATFQAFGKGQFELRREVSLDLSKATTVLVDVYSDAGPMDLALAFRAGYYTTLFSAPAKPIQTGWNKDVAFPLQGLTASEGGWGSSWNWSRDNVTRVSLIFGERDEKKGSVTVDNLRFDRPATELGQKAKPTIKRITASATTVERYEPIELTLQFQAEYQNFFDRSQVDVRATFFAPSGKRYEVHGFMYGVDETTGKPVWRIRFAPTEIGLWRYDVVLKDAAGEAASQTYEFLCQRQNDHRGFIRVSKSDPQYFEFDDGSLYYPVGQNVCWATNYDHFLKSIQAYGGNYVRVWLCPWNLQLEDPREPGKYDLRAAKALDDLLGLCQGRGVYVQLVLRYHGMHSDSWDKNPYNAANGGPCKWPSDFFLETKAKDLHKSFLDYAVARWGHSTALFAWELWNEADLARADRESDLVDWHRDMAAYLKKIDYGRHLVTTSVATPGRCNALFELPDIDFIPVHFYAPDMFAKVYEAYQQYRRYRKPIFIGEFSAGHRPSDDLDDAKGVRLHAALWLTLTTPMAGNAMPWWWDTFVDANKLYPHWQVLTRFAKGMDPRGKSYEVIRSKIELSEGVSASLQGLVAPSEAYLWVYDEERILRPERAERPLLPAPREVRLDGLLGGRFKVEVWDPYDGKVLSQATVATADGTLKFNVPACSRDIAVKVTRDGAARPRLEW